MNEFTHTNLLSLVAFCMSNFMTSDVTLLHTESKETSIMHGKNHVHYVHKGSHKIIYTEQKKKRNNRPPKIFEFKG